MLHKNSPFNSTSAEFEKAALKKFRTLAMCVPADCKVFREPWGCQAVVCLDFQACPSELVTTQDKTNLLITAAEKLGLAQSVIFRVGKKVRGWQRITNPNSQ